MVEGDRWPFVGREREFADLRTLLHSGKRGAVLVGASGVGKTRLAQETARWAETRGFGTVEVTATRSAAGLPFGAFASLLPTMHDHEDRTVDRPVELLRHYADGLVDLAGGKRLFLLVDDAHLLDHASAALVHQMASTHRATVLATLRTDEPGPDAVTALWKDELASRVEIGGLDPAAVEQILIATLGDLVDGGAVARLVSLSDGNALYLREMITGALEGGSLHFADGLWQLADAVPPPQRLVDLVEARLSGLEPAERRLLELVAFGEPLRSAEVDGLGDTPLVDSLEERGFLISRRLARGVETRLAHPMFGDVLRARVSARQVPGITRTLAEVAEAAGLDRKEDVLRVATWRLEGGGGTPRQMLDAALIARWRYDFPLAERLARSAIELGAGFDAELLAAQVAGRQGRSEEAEREFARLTEIATDDEQRGAVAVDRLDNHAFSLGQVDEGLVIAEAAEVTISDQAWRDEIASRRAGILLGIQGFRACATVAEPLLERANGRAKVWASVNVAYCLGRLGRIQAAIDATVVGHAMHLSADQPLDWDPSLHLYFRCDHLAHAGRFAEAAELAQGNYQEATRSGNTEAQAWFAWHLGKMVADRGNALPAIRYAREAVTLFRQLGRPLEVQFSLASLALALAIGAQTGREAAAVLRELDAMEVPLALYVAVDVQHARAWAAVAENDLPRGRRHLQEGAALGEEIGDLVGAAAALHGLARLGHADEAVGRLELVADQIEGALAPARLAHTRALAARDADALLVVSQEFEEMGAFLIAAESAADAGVVLRKSKRSRLAVGAHDRARTLRERCPGAITPALQSTEGRARLTRAEHDVALLAAGGQTNKAIATELNLSIRTVENQLQHAYEKLGISGRRDLADALSESPDVEAGAVRR